MALLVVNWYGTIHLLHSLFFVQTCDYSTTRLIFAFIGNLPEDRLPPVVYIPLDAFDVQRPVCDVPQTDHQIRMGGFPQIDWPSMLCEKLGNTTPFT